MSESIPPREPERRPTTQVIIERAEPIAGVTNSRMIFSSAKIKFTQESGTGIEVNSISDSPNIDNLEIYIRDIGKPAKVNLPPELVRRFAEYLRNIPEYSKKFDCSEFVHFLYGIKNTFKAFESITDNWTLGPIKVDAPLFRNDLQLGDVICFMQQSADVKISLVHFAIYLGQDVLLSQSGIGGKLIATDFSTTMRMHSATSWTKLTPKPDAPAWTPDDQS